MFTGSKIYPDNEKSCFNNPADRNIILLWFCI